MKRNVYAAIEVDDDIAFQKTDDGPIPYLELEMNKLEKKGIVLQNAFIADSDEECKWLRYLNHMIEWAFEHYDEDCAAAFPAESKNSIR